MTEGPTRRAGTGLLDWGGRVTWTVADGARGRRWRSVLTDDGQVVAALLLETRPDASIARLELATPGGLLTLHPEGPTLHGNVVRPGGVEHLTLPWDGAFQLLGVGTPATAAAAAARLDSRIGVGEGHTIPVVSVDARLSVQRVTYRVIRPAANRWRFLPAGGGIGVAVELDTDGIPVLDDAESWPLERTDTT